MPIAGPLIERSSFLMVVTFPIQTHQNFLRMRLCSNSGVHKHQVIRRANRVHSSEAEKRADKIHHTKLRLREGKIFPIARATRATFPHGPRL